jgi:uncharacterized 2Fe-2S/4Fe-4S cluster protein (DUF4445 family)
MKEFFTEHSITEMGLVIIVGTVAIIAACYQEWATAGSVATGAFAIMKGRRI